MSKILLEDRRTKLLSKAKKGDDYVWYNQHNGRNRYERRLKSRLASSVKNFNQINMDKFFKADNLDVSIDVKGETNVYVVRISFSGVLEELKNLLVTEDIELDRKLVLKALTRAFNGDDVYIRCDCPDFRYRHAYFATKNNIIVGEPENRPSDETNPYDTKGPGCKHITLALTDSSWLIRVASVIYNYIEFMKDHKENLYDKYIYPAIYGKEYDNRQLDISDIDNEEPEFDSDQDTLDKANQQAKVKGQFKQGNEYRFKNNNIDDNQMKFDLDSLDNNEEDSEEEPES